MTTTEPTCDQRIQAQHDSRSEYLRELFERIDNDTPGEDYEDPTDELHEFPLWVEVRRVLRIDLSTGGPADYVTVEVDENGRLTSDPVYHFADWFDHAEIKAGPEFERLAEWYAEIAVV